MPQIPRLGLAGISGIGQSTAAVQSLFSRARGATMHTLSGARRATKKRTKSSGSKKKRGVSASGKKRKASSKGKYNSKAWMAKIRKMRK